MINITMMPDVNWLMLYIKLISILIRILFIKEIAKNIYHVKNTLGRSLWYQKMVFKGLIYQGEIFSIIDKFGN